GAAVLLDERVELGAFVVQRHIERNHQRLPITSQAEGHSSLLADIDLGTISIDVAYRTDRTNRPLITDLTTLPRPPETPVDPVDIK
ncbi:MAG: hypothetical protein M3137_00255, partial [Actinomycetota bacterium]|nr:hypothetical protein [Actinomycetota bacterium]